MSRIPSSRVLLSALLLLLSGCGSTPDTPPSPAPVVRASPADARANEVLFRALGLVGTPYQWGGNTPASGFDCSGLIVYVFREAAGIRLPRTTRSMSSVPLLAVSRASLQPGDLLFFATGGGSTVSHAGIYVGEGRFVHAPSSGGTVRLDRLTTRYWQRTFRGARRVFGSTWLAERR